MIRCCLLLLLMVGLSGCTFEAKEPEVNEVITEKPHSLQVALREWDSDGRQVETVRHETIWAMEDFWAKYQDWQLIDMNEQYIIFEKK